MWTLCASFLSISVRICTYSVPNKELFPRLRTVSDPANKDDCRYSRYIKHNGMNTFQISSLIFMISQDSHETFIAQTLKNYLVTVIASQLKFRYDFRNAFIPLCKAKCRQLELEIAFYSLCLQMVSYPNKIT